MEIKWTTTGHEQGSAFAGKSNRTPLKQGIYYIHLFICLMSYPNLSLLVQFFLVLATSYIVHELFASPVLPYKS